MIISCPQCSTGYLLPEHLMGPGGARVRCPRCQHLFDVGPDGSTRLPPEVAEAPPPDTLEVREEPAAQSAPPPAPAGEPAPAAAAQADPPAAASAPAPEREDPLATAHALLSELAERSGDALEQARAGQRLFAEFGPALMETYEAYRRRAGREAGPGPFRAALRERWGVDLVPLQVSD